MSFDAPGASGDPKKLQEHHFVGHDHDHVCWRARTSSPSASLRRRKTEGSVDIATKLQHPLLLSTVPNAVGNTVAAVIPGAVHAPYRHAVSTSTYGDHITTGHAAPLFSLPSSSFSNIIPATVDHSLGHGIIDPQGTLALLNHRQQHTSIRNNLSGYQSPSATSALSPLYLASHHQGSTGSQIGALSNHDLLSAISLSPPSPYQQLLGFLPAPPAPPNCILPTSSRLGSLFTFPTINRTEAFPGGTSPLYQSNMMEFSQQPTDTTSILSRSADLIGLANSMLAMPSFNVAPSSLSPINSSRATAPLGDLLFASYPQDRRNTTTDASLSMGIIRERENFPMVLHRALRQLELVPRGTSIVTFMPNGKSFQIKNQFLIEKHVLPVFFPKMKGFASFQRQLNLYDFKRIGGTGIDRGAYHHDLFVRDSPASSGNMKRRKIKGTHCSRSRETESTRVRSPSGSTS